MKNDAISKALAIVDRGIVKPAPALVRKAPEKPRPLLTRPYPHIAVIDLPRFCALHIKPYVARYIGGQAGSEYAQSIRMTDSVMRGQYDNSVAQDFDTRFLGHEHCPWCGSYNDEWCGAIRCEDCKRLFCYGTTINGYFSCPCGKSGKLIGCERRERGLVPGHRGGNQNGL